MLARMGDPRALMERLTAEQNAHDLEGMLACFHEDYRSEQPLSACKRWTVRPGSPQRR